MINNIPECICDEVFLSKYLEYVHRTLQSDGSAFLIVSKNNTFEGGMLFGEVPWVVSSRIEQELLSNSHKHGDFIRNMTIPFSVSQIEQLCKENNYAMLTGAFQQFPTSNTGEFVRRLLISPIWVQSKIFACVIMAPRTDANDDISNICEGKSLVRLNEIASLYLESLSLYCECNKCEKDRIDKEEEMLHMSSVIIHEIGNDITAAKLLMHELQELNYGSGENPESLIINEIVPRLYNELDSGNIENFLRNDCTGNQFMGIIVELLMHVNDSRTSSRKLLYSLSDKLRHISDIIESHQIFDGEMRVGRILLNQINKQ